jgi:uncharacterized membrane protein
MAVLIILVLLLLLFIFLLLYSINNKASENSIDLKNTGVKLDELTRKIQHLEAELKKQPTIKEEPPAKKEEAPGYFKPTPAAPRPVPDIVKPVEKVPLLTVPYDSAEEPEDIDERKYTEQERDVWYKRNSDLERFIGENLANKIGIAVLVLGISFFVKYAIDKNWITETGRVIIGLVSGGILIGLAHYIRNNYRSFSSVLVGGGLTVFYFTIAFAFHQYHLISQQAAFMIMVVITAFAVLLSLYYARQELAILATIGGFITPFLVSTGENNYVALFTYLCILNTGLMTLAWFKRWPAINIIALFFTTLIYGGWLVERTVFTHRGTLPYRDALLFASLFYILFIAMNVINSLRMKRKFMSFDFFIVLLVNFLYYIAGIVILDDGHEAYKGLFTALLGIFNFILTVIFYRNKNIDPNFVSLLISLTLTFISLTAPVQFDGNSIVLFWAAEAVALLWLYQRSGIVHLRLGSFVIVGLMLGNLVITWITTYLGNADIVPVVVNQGFVTTLAAAVSLFIYYLLLRRKPEAIFMQGYPNAVIKNWFLAAAIVVAYLAGCLEITHQFTSRYPDTYIYAIYLQLYSFAYAMLVLKIFRRSTAFPLLKLSLTSLSLGIYLFSLRPNYIVSAELLKGNDSSFFIAHWISAILLIWLLADMVRFFFRKDNRERWSDYQASFMWLTAISLVLVLSVELYHVILWTTYRSDEDWVWWENLYYKAGLTILWSICSFTMMWLGMKFNFRALRIISLSLFTITLVKLFAYDIRNIPPGGKIAAFILLGVLLLTVSFMYQRLKRIIINEK